MYNYPKQDLNEKLVEYIEKNIFPQYDLNEEGHNINHIITVINHAFDIAKNYNIDINILYTVVAYHDIAHHIDKDKHEKISANIMYDDLNLNTFFNKEELSIIKLAIEDHRASSSIIPRNIYGKIVSVADKNLTLKDAILRTYFYTKKHSPEYNTDEKIFDRIYEHLSEKFGENGYAKIYIKDEKFDNFKKELIELLKNKDNFYKVVKDTISKNK